MSQPGVQLPTRIDGDASTSIAEAMNTSGQSVSSASANRDAANSLNSRRSITVNAGQSLSFGTYFNAFPASYWRRWTDLQKVVLSVQTRGEGMVIVYKSNGRGVIQRVDAKLLSGEETNTFTLPWHRSVTAAGTGSTWQAPPTLSWLRRTGWAILSPAQT